MQSYIFKSLIIVMITRLRELPGIFLTFFSFDFRTKNIIIVNWSWLYKFSLGSVCNYKFCPLWAGCKFIFVHSMLCIFSLIIYQNILRPDNINVKDTNSPFTSIPLIRYYICREFDTIITNAFWIINRVTCLFLRI